MSGWRIAFVGTGIMGAPMAANLLRAGFPVTVWNRTPSKAESLVQAGAQRSDVLEAVVLSADSVHLCLKNPAAVEGVLFEGGVLHAMAPGQILVDHGTSGLALTRRVAQVCGERGIGFLDAPVSGGFEGARDATLAIMAGGEQPIFERVRPTLEAMGRTVRYVGPSGSGQALKLANQLLVIVQQFAAAEAFAFARKAGVDGQVFAEIIANAWGRSFMLERSLPGFLAGDHAPGRASLTTLGKDGGLIADSASELGQALPLFEAAHRLLQEAVERGYGEEDITASLRLYLG
ncbi:MAG TPA: NAD(P)-dependent oxidoreductase [Chloroflexota bacterium]|nr:NAD(P)-dependent oxidoreductase [Chloroflexota bacterium]